MKKEIIKAINDWNEHIIAFNKIRQDRYVMISMRKCNWDMYIKDLKDRIRDCD